MQVQSILRFEESLSQLETHKTPPKITQKSPKIYPKITQNNVHLAFWTMYFNVTGTSVFLLPPNINLQ